MRIVRLFIISIVTGTLFGLFCFVIEKWLSIKIYTLLMNIDYIPILKKYAFPAWIEFSFHLMVCVLLTFIFAHFMMHFCWHNKQIVSYAVLVNVVISLVIFPTTALSDQTPALTSMPSFTLLNAQQLIDMLQLEAHPEGGFYTSTFRSESFLQLPQGERPYYTSIYFLLRSQDISHLHRLKSDEVWYYHGGSALTVHMILPDGTYEAKRLGFNVENGEVPQVVVRKNTIFGSSIEEANTFSLVGCMVSPGFDFQDFELFTQQQLLVNYPQHEAVIRKLAYETLPE